jgi:hypothetical protein
MTELQAMINRALRDAGQPIPTAAMAAPPDSSPVGSAPAIAPAKPAANAAPATNVPPAPK